MRTVNFKENPFQFGGKWYWYDEGGENVGPYNTHRAALRDLMEHTLVVEGYMSWRRRMWKFLKELWRDESTIPRRKRK